MAEVILDTYQEGDKLRRKILEDEQVFSFNTHGVYLKFCPEVMEAVETLNRYRVDMVDSCYTKTDGYEKFYYWKGRTRRLRLITTSIPDPILEDKTVLYITRAEAEKARDAFDKATGKKTEAA